MGKLFFGLDMQQTIGDAFAPGTVPDITLRKKTLGGYDPANPSAGRQTTTKDYACRGTITAFKREECSEDNGIQEGDSFVGIVAQPLAVFDVEPSKDDLVIDDDGNHYVIVGVTTSGLRASYRCHLRGLTQRSDE